VLGLVGTNGIGKSTALQILAGKVKPNLGLYNTPPEWEAILKHFRGSELQNYLQKIVENKLKCVIKPQYVDSISKVVKGRVLDHITKRDEEGRAADLIKELALDGLLDNAVEKLSGGELQRFAICMASLSKANIYMFDEPSSYLDVK
jgi:ATP-binding cassette, sub-family E, member 1